MNFGDLSLLEARCGLVRTRHSTLPNSDYQASLRQLRWVERWRESLRVKALQQIYASRLPEASR